VPEKNRKTLVHGRWLGQSFVTISQNNGHKNGITRIRFIKVVDKLARNGIVKFDGKSLTQSFYESLNIGFFFVFCKKFKPDESEEYSEEDNELYTSSMVKPRNDLCCSNMVCCE
jgi:hypothetical protein